MREDRYIIEARHPDGSLDLTAPQPEEFWGIKAITGISQDEMARVIYRLHPEVDTSRSILLDGAQICLWPRVIDIRFTARRKTW